MTNQTQKNDCFMTIPTLIGKLNGDGKVVSREFVYRAAKQGKIPSYRIGKKIFVRFPEVLEALRQG
jgi:excisionase family DNA binding protein